MIYMIPYQLPMVHGHVSASQCKCYVDSKHNLILSRVVKRESLVMSRKDAKL